MADLSQYSDEQLMGMLQQHAAQTDATTSPSPERQMVDQNKFEMGQGMPGVGKQLGAYGLNALQSIPFSDEAISGVGAAFGGGEGQNFGQRYENLQQRQQAFRKAGEELNPGATMMGQVGGGLATAGLMPTAESTSMLGSIAKNTGIGMGYGGIFGAGEGNAFKSNDGSMGDRASNAGFGALAGGALGAALPVIGSTMMSGFARTPPAEKLAAKNIADVLSRDKLDVSNIPVDQNILQAGGNAAASRAEAITTRGSEGSDLMTDYAVKQRVDLPKDLSDTLGKPFAETNYPGLLEAIKNKARTEAGPAYDTAYSALTKINDPQINQALDRSVAAGDWPVLTSEAKKLAAYEGKTLGNIDATGMARSYSTQDLDYMTRALRNLGQGTEGMGAFGNKTPLGAMRANNAGLIRDRLKTLNPDFSTATEQYAGDIAIHEAAQNGKQANLLGNNWKQYVSDYSKLGPSEKAAWRVGQAENLQTMIANNPGAALTRMNSPQFAKVMQNFYSPSEYKSLIENSQQLSKEQNQIRQITGNSRTATRALQQLNDKMDDGSIVESVIRSGPRKMAKDFITDKIVNRFSNGPRRQAADAQIARTLLSSPFQLSSQQTGGFMPQMMQSALSGNPLVDNILYKRIQQNNEFNRYLPALMSSGGGQ